MTKLFIHVVLSNGRWRADRVSDQTTVRQIRAKAGLQLIPWPDPPDTYDKLLIAAGELGYGLETTEP